MTFKIEWRKREQMGNSVGMNRMKRMRIAQAAGRSDGWVTRIGQK
jgi:hypothetical protein